MEKPIDYDEHKTVVQCMQHIRNYRGLHTSREFTTLTWLSNRQLIRIDEESNHGSLMLETTAKPTLPQPVAYNFSHAKMSAINNFASLKNQ